MKGQWLGIYGGTSEGLLVLSLDELEDCYEGNALIRPDDQQLPTLAFYFKTPNKSPKIQLETGIVPIDKFTKLPSTWTGMKDQYAPDISMPTKVAMELEMHDDSLAVRAITDRSLTLICDIPKPTTSKMSKISGTQMSWAQFKDRVGSLQNSDYVFRGQKEPWSLRTSFHRRERFALHRFVSNDLPVLHRRLSAVTSHYFDLNIPEQNGAFFNLIQHHGYPTPLLDWTYSPFVAAFFAFRALTQDYDSDALTRVYLFNRRAWIQRMEQYQHLGVGVLHLSVMEFIPINNPRVVPQQSVTTLTNINDIEEYILICEKRDGVRYLEAIDIPANERERAMADMRYMGITAGSMFPGIDGICEEIRELKF